MKRPLVVTEEDERLEQLKDGEHVAEEGHMVLLPELVHVEVDAAVQQACDHGQVSGETRGVLSAMKSRPHLQMLFNSRQVSPEEEDRVRHSQLPTGQVGVKNAAFGRLGV